MSWIQDLYETYENCEPQIGKSGDERDRPLLPVCHITAQAQVEIVINKVGEFLDARIIKDQKNDAETIIPCTESSASRAGSKPTSHPLCDKLQYIAGDFVQFGGEVTSGFKKDPYEPFRDYVKNLESWCASDFYHPKIEAVLNYVKKKRVVQDLAVQKILYIGKNGKFLEKKDVKREKGIEDIFTVANSQESITVRWIVEIPGVLESRVWRDETLWNSWINFYTHSKEKENHCFVTGKEEILTRNHPKYIRVKGDGAKIISANDTNGFTFLGRFLDDQQACNVSLDVSQKAHYALLWLIDRQGRIFFENKGREPGLTIVAWAKSTKKIPQMMDDGFSILGDDVFLDDAEQKANTAQELGIMLKNRIAGYGKRFDIKEEIIVMGLDAATSGRMAIIYYKKLSGSDFIKGIENWHESCSWLHRYRFVSVPNPEGGEEKRKYVVFVGAPSPYDIAGAAYGSRLDDTLRKATIKRLMPCIVDGQPIPRDLVESAVRRASNPVSVEKWEWDKTLSIACALYKKSMQKENYEMALNPDRKTRDYLYGRLLALAENLESWALSEAKEDRQTNATRLMQRFSERPFSTWNTLELALTPYKARLGRKGYKLQRMIDEIMALFDEEDYLSDKRLSGEFLLGYHCQREFLRNRSKDNSEDNLETDLVEEIIEF